MKHFFTLLIACVISSSAFANLNGYLASSGASKESLEEVEYSTYGAYLHFDKLPKVLFLVDGIEDGDIFDFRRALRKHPSISAVVLDSEGGLVSEALLIAGVVSDRGMTTYVPTDALCASACSFIYFAGKSRLVKGALGVHQFSNADNTKRDNINEVQQNTQYTTSEIISFLNGFDTPSFVYEEMFASSEMYFFTKEERIILSSHSSLALSDSVDAFIEDLNKESELENESSQVGSIKSLQTELKRVGCYAGLVDGVRGRVTEQALDTYLKRKARSLDWSTDALVKIIKHLRNEVRVACVEEYTVSTPVVVPKPSLETDSEIYKNAFKLVKDRRYPEAIIAFEKFVIERPASPLLGNAHYWLGELFFVQGQWSQGVVSFKNVLNIKPPHRKLADAMYKMGVGYENLGTLYSAGRMFQAVIKDFPDTEAAKLSRERLPSPTLTLDTEAAKRLPSHTLTLGTLYNDQLIETSTVDAVIRASPLLKTAHINAVSVNGIVLLIGQVPSEDTKIIAGAKARGITNVRKVHNELLVSGPSSYVVRTNDTLITTNVKARMVREKAFPAKHFTVSTENGVVYLMGLVTRQEADWAVRITSKSSGIQRIVKVFEYID